MGACASMARKRRVRFARTSSPLRKSTEMSDAYGERGRLLGRGAFGEVFLYESGRNVVVANEDATDEGGKASMRDGNAMKKGASVGEVSKSQLVAVKEMDKRKLANVRVGRERTLLDEAEEESEMQSECACENVVRAYEWVNDVKENRARLVMEYCPEGSVLDEEETFERFRADDVKAIARDLFRALRTCHERGVAHLDVKPQNVFVGGEGLYKLGDFGCAVRVTRRRDGTYEPVGKTPGTPAFTAPECCDGEPCDGFKADVWAAGMTIHALATGKYFYQADSAWETYQKILETRVDMSEIEATEDELFIDFLRQILQRCPKSRLTAKQALKHPWFPIEVQHSASLTPATRVLGFQPLRRGARRARRVLRNVFGRGGKR